MKRMFLHLFLFSALLGAVQAGAEDKPVFGPVKYDVKERYGKENRYTEKITAVDGLYLIKVQNGESLAERTDFLEFFVNGEKLLKEDKYEYHFLVCYVKLQKENTFTLVIKDEVPSGFKRPTPAPKNVTISIIPAPVKIGKVVIGVNYWESLGNRTAALLKIKDPAAASLAILVASLQTETAVRVEGMKQLAEHKDQDAGDFLLGIYEDFADKPEVRGEASIGLGMLMDKKNAPTLMNGVLDPEEQIRIGASKALSYYSEEDTRELLKKTLAQLDPIRKDAVVRAIVAAGWKPVSTLVEMAEGTDLNSSNMAVALMGGSNDPRVRDLLLKYLRTPGPRNINTIIRALGECKEVRALEPLMAMAKDPAQRKGKELDLGLAFANIGDPSAIEMIVEMMNKTNRVSVRDGLRDAYKRLTGKEYNRNN